MATTPTISQDQAAQAVGDLLDAFRSGEAKNDKLRVGISGSVLSGYVMQQARNKFQPAPPDPSLESTEGLDDERMNVLPRTTVPKVAPSGSDPCYGLNYDELVHLAHAIRHQEQVGNFPYNAAPRDVIVKQILDMLFAWIAEHGVEWIIGAI